MLYILCLVLKGYNDWHDKCRQLCVCVCACVVLCMCLRVRAVVADIVSITVLSFRIEAEGNVM
jgi:hypothetical protein